MTQPGRRRLDMVKADARHRGGRAKADPAHWPADPAEAAARGFVPPPTEAEAVEQYHGLVLGLVGHFQTLVPKAGDRDALVTVGQMAVVTAHRRWRPEFGTKFLSYLETCVPRAMWQHVKVEQRQGLTWLEGVRPTRAGLDDLSVRSGTPGRTASLRSRVEAAHRRRGATMPVHWSDADWADVLRHLPSRHAEVLRRRLHGETLREVAADLGVTRERVRQIEAQAVQKLRSVAGHVPALRDNIPVPEE